MQMNPGYRDTVVRSIVLIQVGGRIAPSHPGFRFAGWQLQWCRLQAASCFWKRERKRTLSIAVPICSIKHVVHLFETKMKAVVKADRRPNTTTGQ